MGRGRTGDRGEGKGKERGSLSFAAGRRKKSRHLMSAGNVDTYIHPAGPPREGEDRKPTAGNVADTDVDEDGVDEVVGSLDARHQIWPMSISCTHTHHTFIHLHTRALQEKPVKEKVTVTATFCH